MTAIIGFADLLNENLGRCFSCATGKLCEVPPINRQHVETIHRNGQYLLGIGLILVVLEMARRAIKLALPSVAMLALAYG